MFKLGSPERGEGLSGRMCTRWANFGKGARSAGQPWRPYTATGRAALRIDGHGGVVDDLDRDIRPAWRSVVIGFR